MHSSHLLLEEPIRKASILEPSKAGFFPALAKIVGTPGPRSRSVEVISDCLKAGMSVDRFDFSWGDAEYHKDTLENLKIAIKSTKKLCAEQLDPFSLVDDILSILANSLSSMVIAKVTKLASAAEFFFKMGAEGKTFRPTFGGSIKNQYYNAAYYDKVRS